MLEDSFQAPLLGSDIHFVPRSLPEFIVIVTDEVRDRPAMLCDRLGPFLDAQVHYFGEFGFGCLELPGSCHIGPGSHKLTSLSRLARTNRLKRLIWGLILLVRVHSF